MYFITHRFIAGFEKKPSDLFYDIFKNQIGDFVLTTDTYFNRFPAAHILKNVNAISLRLSGRFAKSGQLLVFAASDTPPLQIAACEVSANIDFLVDLPKTGFLNMWVEFISAEEIDASDITILNWSVDLDKVPEKLLINLATVTINEKDMVDANLKRLAKLNCSEFYEVNEIFVIDQGSQKWDLDKNSKVKIILQSNSGGSGGFARAFFEGTRGTSSGILFFDADVEIYPEIVDRMLSIAFMNFNSSPVSTQMLNLKIPHELLNDNEKIDLTAGWLTVRPQGRQFFHANSKFISLPDPDFLPWWTAYLPTSIIEKIGLPFPFFLHWDDIEYSLRLKKNNVAVLHVPGLSVWHEPFDGKSDKNWIWYFDTRNALVGSALYRRPFHISITKTFHRILLPTFSHRYEVSAFGRQALYDFVNSSDTAIYSGNQRAKLSANQSSSQEQIRVEDYKNFSYLKAPRFFPKLKLLLKSIARIFGWRSNPENLFIAESANASGFLPAFSDSVVIRDRYGSTSEQLQYRRESFLKSLLADFHALSYFVLFYHKAARDHRNHFLRRTSIENWRKEWQ
jgi:GT2 family glycosyltransferase